MSHQQQLEFVGSVKRAFPQSFVGKRVLEVGSLDVNGSVRQHFQDCDYTGLDVDKGPGVDVVCQGQDFDASDASFDTVVSCEVMEHNPYWAETFSNMLRLCKPGGLVLMTCASTYRKEHGTTRTAPQHSPLTIGLGWDYYRNLTAKDFRGSIDLPAWLPFHIFCYNPVSYDLYFCGFRKGAPAPARALAKLLAIKARYIPPNGVATAKRIKRRALITLVGEARYMAGPVRPWSRWHF